MQRLGNDWLDKQSDEVGAAKTLHGSELKTAELVSSVRQSFSFRLVHSFVPNCSDSSLFPIGTNECMLSCGNRWPRTRTKMTMETTAVARATEAWVTVTVPGFNCAPLPTFHRCSPPVASRLQVGAICHRVWSATLRRCNTRRPTALGHKYVAHICYVQPTQCFFIKCYMQP